MPITVTLRVLRDNSEGIFGTYKFNVLTWLELLILCMIFLPLLIFLKRSYSTFYYKGHFHILIQRRFGFFDGISTLVGYSMRNSSFWKKKSHYHFAHSWEDNKVYSFPKGICPKVNVIALLRFELVYYDSVVHRFNHYTKMPPTLMLNGYPFP